MNKIIDYYVLVEYSDDELQSEVVDGIRNGYQPFGSISTVHVGGRDVKYVQPMVKYEGGAK